MNLLHKNNTNALPKAKSTDTHDFGEGSISGNILHLAIPMTLAQLINVLYNIIDRIYIGHIPEAGSAPLTGVGLCFPLITLVMAFSSLVCAGGAPRAAQPQVHGGCRPDHGRSEEPRPVRKAQCLHLCGDLFPYGDPA